MVRRTVTARSTKGGASRGRQSRRKDDDDIPEVYREMLAEEEERESHVSENDRPLKRRKVTEQPAPVDPQPKSQEIPLEKSEDVDRPVQTAYDSTASDDDDSDMEWEEVDISQAPSTLNQTTSTSQGNDEPIQITFDQQKEKDKRKIIRRKPVSAAERKLRLDIHKVHLLCLLRHVQLRNLWCNDEDVQGFLKKMLSRQVISLLNPAESKPQYSRSTTFVDGLNQASDAFMRRFRVTKSGLKQAHWADGPDSLKQKMESIMFDPEVFLSKEDFKKQAKTLQGSRDFGAQLFCALLRSAAVEARLVCSLQPLPFSGAVKKDSTSKRPESKYIIVSSDDHETSTDERSKSNTPAPQRGRRLGRPQFAPSLPQTSVRSGPLPSPRESLYPVFWVEAFNEAVQKWIPIDPLVTKSLAKPSKFEPPASDQYNNMCYVVAFEEDASGRDVTRRYAKAFNAKTRKLRVESTKNGEKWWAKALAFYEKPFPEDRDEIEISELTAKTAAEPMPRNVQDFKNHPIYALERHLRRNEVIFPKRVIGQVGLSKTGPKSQALEPVYRRTDIHVLRGADGWYRLGRDIKMGEQPLKRVRANRNKIGDVNYDENGIIEDVETALYADFQTELYKPPPVVKGKIPKNVYGNLDIYVASMVPPGGIHIKRSDAAHAAKILGIDYADAVTGFEFKGRHGTAVVKGIVIASEYQEALEEVLNCLEEDRVRTELEGKSAEALGLWKHFLLRLRIAERVKNYAVEGDEDIDDVNDEDYEEAEEAESMGGGFFPEPGQETRSPPLNLNTRMSGQAVSNVHEAENNLTGADEDEFLGGGFLPEEPLDSMEEPEPLPLNQTNSIEIAGRTQTANAPRFSLVVVSNDQTRPRDNMDSKPDGNSFTDAMQGNAPAESKDTTEEVHKDHGGSSAAPAMVESRGSKPDNVEEVSQGASQTQLKAESPESMEKESGSNDEGSLLSQDPDDEDAIPEWLM